MEILRDISLFLILINILFVFSSLFKSRFSKRATLIANTGCLIFVLAINVLGLIFYGVEVMAKYILVTCSVPSFLFFLFMSDYRDFRFIFTFCVADVMALWVLDVTALFNFMAGDMKYLWMLLSRVALSLLQDYYLFSHVREEYRRTQSVVSSGWGIQSLILVLLYILLSVAPAFPTVIWKRPDDLVSYLLILAVVPLILYGMYFMLSRQLYVTVTRYREKNISEHMRAMQRQLENLRDAELSRRIERHDIRHQLNQVDALLQAGDSEGARAALNRYAQRNREIDETRYCENMMLNAMFSYYFRMAKEQGIRVEAQLEMPDDLPLDALEMSVAIANLLENAIQACEALSPEKKRIAVTSVCRDQMFFEIANPYEGDIRFNESGLPISEKGSDHGIGTLSVSSFARKLGAIYQCAAKDGEFRAWLMVNLTRAHDADESARPVSAS